MAVIRNYGGLLIAFLLLCCNMLVFAQQNSMAKSGNTYAVVIGIASYLDPDIPALSFSNKDATVFADFLMSASGGSVPKQNIKLLTDSMATIGEVDKAMRWLLNSCQEGDKVYFYFSGHGEMENATMSKNGYLICYNTPSVAFVYMGLSIDYLNDVANTLSVQTKAKVVMITDACHSGKMAGDKFRGNFFVGEQLMLKKANEIRMTSSQADQLSNENVDWGGGRGVFSYYLINGMQGGLADANQDGTVSLGELKAYLEHSMANDLILRNEGDIQTPVINGNADFKLATVITSEAVKIKEEVKEDSARIVMVTMSRLNKEENAEPAEYFFSNLKKTNLGELTEDLKLNNLSSDEIVFAIINRFKTINANSEIKYTQLETDLKANKEKLNSFNLDVASTFLDVGQTVITNYIKGDEAELERRRYYNSNNNGYDVYPKMFSVAVKLSQTDKYYSTKAAVFLHYFSGVALRLKIPLTENPTPLIERAFAEQQKALALEAYAAYIYNEMGILYQYKKNNAEAEKNYIKATQLSPGWAIPQSNLSGLYAAKKDYHRALKAIDKADSLQPGLQSTEINRGFISEKNGNLLFAEENYRNAININSRHFSPFERLGFVYMNTTDYAQADSFFYEADLRKRGYHFEGNNWEFSPDKQAITPMSTTYCNIDSSILEPTDIFAFFTWGVQEYQEKKYENAARILRKVVALDKTNPLVFHYLGKIYYDQQHWEEAELMFTLATKYAVNRSRFDFYVDSVIASKKYPYDHECFENYFRWHYYGWINNFYFLGTLYENWKHLEEAENYFRAITRFNTGLQHEKNAVEQNDQNDKEITEFEKTAAYVKLWQMLEKQGRYNEAEEVIEDFRKISEKKADEELNEFYRRVIDRYPDNGNWVYRLGNLLYKYAPVTARLTYVDSIVWFPLLKKEIFIDSTVYLKLAVNDSLALYDKSETGSISSVILDPDNVLVDRRQSYYVPGTGESILGADAIYMPRKDGIAYLQRAAALLSEKESLADIHFKTGNIYLWAGSKKQAYPYFEKSLSLIPDNANARLTLVDIYTALYKNRAALLQLNYLYDSAQINFDKRILLAKFEIHTGNFMKANDLLNKAEYIYPYTLPMIDNLRGLSSMLADKPKNAIRFYTKSINEQETDPWFNYYSLARLYAKTGKRNEAWKNLQSAIDMGFNYSYVLQNDSYMVNLRNTAKWQRMISGISMKKYKNRNPAN
ncbi:MAG: caspase family protein [Ferruginibacter sp.]